MNRIKLGAGAIAFLLVTCIALKAFSAETQREYETRFRTMLQYAVDINEYVRRHLQDKKLCSYAQNMTATNARFAEQILVVEGELPDVHVEGNAPHLAIPGGRLPGAGEEVLLLHALLTGDKIVQRNDGVGHGAPGSGRPPQHHRGSRR